MTFDELDIEGDPKKWCPDYLELFDGPSSESKVLKVNEHDRRICGIVLPNPDSYFSISSSMSIKFVSDGALNMQGFKLIYKSAPKKEPEDNADNGSIDYDYQNDTAVIDNRTDYDSVSDREKGTRVLRNYEVVMIV